MNNINLIGRLTKDPELKQLPNGGTSVCNIILAVKRKKQNETDFINVTAFGKVAENLANYMIKGSQISVSGELRSKTYKKGDETIYSMYVYAERIEFLSKKPMSTDESQLEEIPFPTDGDIPY